MSYCHAKLYLYYSCVRSVEKATIEILSSALLIYCQWSKTDRQSSGLRISIDRNSFARYLGLQVAIVLFTH